MEERKMEEIEIKTEDLKKKIADKINQIKRIVGFINDSAGVLGEVISRDQGSSHTHLVRIVRDFKDFTFLADVGHSMFGGEYFHVWYHPDKKKIDTKKEPPVFSVYYQVSIEESKVAVFDSNPEWLNALNEMIDRQEEVVAEAKRQEENRETQKRLQYEDNEKKKKLLKRAEELKL